VIAPRALTDARHSLGRASGHQHPSASRPAVVTSSPLKKFTGREHHSVDAKGRSSMPSRFRELILESSSGKDAPNLVVIPWFGECVRVYPVNRWRVWIAELETVLSSVDAFGYGEDESDLRRLVYGQAQEVVMDGFGRFMLPQHAREEAGIAGECHWLGLGDFLEMWNPERLDARLLGDNAKRLRARLRELSARSSAARAPSDGLHPEVMPTL